MTAALYIPLAKMLDLWGRAEGFLLMIAFAILGMILMATSNGITTFCVAQVDMLDYRTQLHTDNIRSSTPLVSEA